MFISEREDCWTEVAAPEQQHGSATRWHPDDAINGHNVCQGITALAITLCLPACISDTEPPACCSMLLTLVGQAKPSPFSSSSFKLQFNWGQDYFSPHGEAAVPQIKCLAHWHLSRFKEEQENAAFPHSRCKFIALLKRNKPEAPQCPSLPNRWCYMLGGDVTACEWDSVLWLRRD